VTFGDCAEEESKRRAQARISIQCNNIPIWMYYSNTSLVIGCHQAEQVPIPQTSGPTSTADMFQTGEHVSFVPLTENR
jgi:hypothetical protein